MLAIGRALMAQPTLLLLDEPLLGLAPSVEVRLVRAIREINRDLGITVLVTEQYARPIIPIVDYCYVLENGGAVFAGTPDEFKDSPDVMNAYFGGLYEAEEPHEGVSVSRRAGHQRVREDRRAAFRTRPPLSFWASDSLMRS